MLITYPDPYVSHIPRRRRECIAYCSYNISENSEIYLFLFAYDVCTVKNKNFKLFFLTTGGPHHTQINVNYFHVYIWVGIKGQCHGVFLLLIFCSKDSTWAQLEPSKTGSANFFVFTKICVSVESTTTRTNVFANIIANSRTSRNRFCLFIWGPGGVFNQTVWKSHNTGSLINKRITRKLIKTF